MNTIGQTHMKDTRSRTRGRLLVPALMALLALVGCGRSAPQGSGV